MRLFLRAEKELEEAAQPPEHGRPGETTCMPHSTGPFGYEKDNNSRFREEHTIVILQSNHSAMPFYHISFTVLVVLLAWFAGVIM
jgi:hypothetical protein